MGPVIYHLSGVKDYFLCLFSKRIVCKSEPEVHFYRKIMLRVGRLNHSFKIKSADSGEERLRHRKEILCGCFVFFLRDFFNRNSGLF